MRLLLSLLTALPLFLAPAAARAQQLPAAPPPPSTSGVADFTLAVQPESVTVRRGAAARVEVTVVPQSGFKGRVDLLSSLLYAVAITFEPPSVESGGKSVLTIAPGASSIKGSYIVTVTGVGGGVSHMTTLRVKVR